MADDIGPQLPPHLAKKPITQVSEKNPPFKEIQDDFCGPVLPESCLENDNKTDTSEIAMIKSEQVDDDDDDDDDNHHDDGSKSSKQQCNESDMAYGPALPPGFAVEIPKKVVGPTLPPGWSAGNERETDDDLDDLIGPLPCQAGEMEDVNQKRIEIEERALAMKNKITGKNQDNKVLKRETWMTELPPELGANIGIVARTFKKRTLNSSEADRSVWTETPADRERKRKEQREQQSKKQTQEPTELSQRDLEMQQRVQEHNTQHRGQSLMEMHQQERKKKKGSAPEERRAFSRDVDLDHRKVDKKKMTDFMQNATKFNSKFENAKSGHKFL